MVRKGKQQMKRAERPVVGGKKSAGQDRLYRNSGTEQNTGIGSKRNGNSLLKEFIIEKNK